MAISKKIRQQVYDKCGGHCAYCGHEIVYKDMQVDHIHPQYLGGADDLGNLNPSCRMCNRRKGTLTIEKFRSEIVAQADRAMSTFQARMSLAYGLIQRVNHPVIFYFETINDKINCK